MKRSVVRALVLRTVTAAALVLAACDGSKREETVAARQESSVETKAGETTKAGEFRMDETTKTGETKADASGKGDEVADIKESTMINTLDEVKSFAFTPVDEKGTACQSIFEQGKILEDLSDVKAGGKVIVTYTGTISETNPFEGMVVSIKKA